MGQSARQKHGASTYSPVTDRQIVTQAKESCLQITLGLTNFHLPARIGAL